MNQSFPKSARLLKQGEFDAVYQGDAFAADGTLVIKAVLNGKGETRLGLSVSKKVGNAVVRNRWKRLIREGFRTQRNELPKGLDLVVRPKKGAVCDGRAIALSISKLVARLDRRLRRNSS